MPKYHLEAVVFFCGLSVMILELVGSRLLAPFVGISIVVWSSLIGIILTALSAGYFFGGKLADKNPQPKVLSWIIFWAAVSVVLIVGLKFIFFELLAGSGFDLRTKAVILSLLLFAAPSTLLGMVSPFAAKLKTESVQKIGGTVGNLYALSTVGSITGTFLAGFYLTAVFPIPQIITGISLVLLVCSFLIYKSNIQHSIFKILIFLLACLITFFLQDTLKNPHVLTKDTQYNTVSIYEEPYYKDQRPIRVMSLDNKYDSAMYLDSDDLVFDYTKYYRLANAFTPEVKKILVIGGAGYSVPKDFLKRGVQVDVVELDPELTKLAEKYFNLQLFEPERRDQGFQSRRPTYYPLLTIFHEDGRTFLNREQNPQYDAIMVDAFKSYSIPYQLTTTESIGNLKKLLKPNGVVLANVISSIKGEKGRFFQAEYATFKQNFPYVYVFGVTNPESGDTVQNLMLVGANTGQINPPNEEIRQYLTHQWKGPIEEGQILTDDFAPVDQLMLATML